MSQAPYAVRGIRFGTQLGKNPPFEDTLWAGLVDSYVKVSFFFFFLIFPSF